MKTFTDAIDRMDKLINSYFRMSKMDGNQLSQLMKDLSALLYYLSTVRSDYHDKFQTRINELVSEGSSVARAENQANVDIPEMYRLRRTMDAANDCLQSMRSNLSWIKREMDMSN